MLEVKGHAPAGGWSGPRDGGLGKIRHLPMSPATGEGRHVARPTRCDFCLRCTASLKPAAQISQHLCRDNGRHWRSALPVELCTFYRTEYRDQRVEMQHECIKNALIAPCSPKKNPFTPYKQPP